MRYRNLPRGSLYELQIQAVQVGGVLACLYRASYRGRPVQANKLAPGGPYKLYKLRGLP